MKSKIIEVALNEIGICEVPKNSNKTKYGEWFGLNGVAWCGIFVSWCYYMAGVELPKIGFSKQGYAGCQSAFDYFKKKNMIVTKPEAGDIVLFDWNGDKRYDHTGIFVKDLGGLTFESVEGNTAVGNDSNGGKVMLRNREYKFAIFIRIV